MAILTRRNRIPDLLVRNRIGHRAKKAPAGYSAFLVFKISSAFTTRL
jgi:hypothetical protein